MKKSSLVVCGVLGLSGLLAGACGSDSTDDADGGAGSGGTASGGSASGGTSSGGSESGGSPSSGGSESGGSTASGGMGGAPPWPTCEEIPSFEFGGGDAGAGGLGGMGGMGGFDVTVDEYESCAPIPDAHTCEGRDFPLGDSPTVTWSNPPAGTKSFAVTFKDIAIVAGVPETEPAHNQGFHWVIWDIPADVMSIPAELGDGHAVEEIEGARQFSPFNNYSFMGPCPNAFGVEEGMEPRNDSYAFVVYAMPTEVADVPAQEEGISPVRLMDMYFRENAIAAVEYRGTSNAVPSGIPDGTLPPMFDVPCPSEGEQPDGCLEAP